MNGHFSHLPRLNYGSKIECLRKACQVVRFPAFFVFLFRVFGLGFQACMCAHALCICMQTRSVCMHTVGICTHTLCMCMHTRVQKPQFTSIWLFFIFFYTFSFCLSLSFISLGTHSSVLSCFMHVYANSKCAYTSN